MSDRIERELRELRTSVERVDGIVEDLKANLRTVEELAKEERENPKPLTPPLPPNDERFTEEWFKPSGRNEATFWAWSWLSSLPPGDPERQTAADSGAEAWGRESRSRTNRNDPGSWDARMNSDAWRQWGRGEWKP